MAYQFFVNMQKRSDGKVYSDLQKTDERIHFFLEDAQKAIESDPSVAEHRHVVPMVATTLDDWEAQAAFEKSFDEILYRVSKGALSKITAFNLIAQSWNKSRER